LSLYCRFSVENKFFFSSSSQGSATELFLLILCLPRPHGDDLQACVRLSFQRRSASTRRLSRKSSLIGCGVDKKT